MGGQVEAGKGKGKSATGNRASADGNSAAEGGEAVDGARFANEPVYGWLAYASLRRNSDTLPTDQAQSFLSRHEGQAVADTFRSVWLAALARRKDWPAFRAAWDPSIDDVALRCAELDARQATGATDAQWIKDAQDIWRSSGKSLPDACDPAFAALAAKGGLPPELRWERIELAATQWQPGVMRAARSDESRPNSSHKCA